MDQNECLRLDSFRTRYIHLYFTRLRFITYLDCLSRASLFGNSALSCIKMNACGCILLERGIYTCTLFAWALLRCLRQYIAWLSGSKKDRELSNRKMNACGCILLERGIYTCTLFAWALLRCLRQYIAWLSGSKKDRELSNRHSRTATDRFRCDGS